MDIRNTKELKAIARRRLRDAQQSKRIALIYCGLALGLALAATALDFLLDQMMDRSGGLSAMGTRTILATFQSILPLVQSVAALCLSLGFMAAMLRVARNQYASPNTLRLGFQRFWPLIRLNLIRGLMWVPVIFVASYIGGLVFLLLPEGKDYMRLMLDLSAQGMSITSPEILANDALYTQLLEIMEPALYISGVLSAILGLPILFLYRMAEYVLIDKPGQGAFAALRASRRMLKGNWGRLLRLDVSLWWYYLALGAVTVLGYANVLLPALGVMLPLSDTAAWLLCAAVYLLGQAAVYYFLRGRVEVTYALAYDAIRPREKPASSGVVLGNIFQL